MNTEVTPPAAATASPHYAGFWIRFCAMIIDSLWLSLVMYAPIIMVALTEVLDKDGNAFLAFYLFFEWVFPALLVLWMWVAFQTTPGKKLLGLKVVDARSLEKASLGQYIGRYLGYFLSMIPLFLGYFWVGRDKHKRGFHDLVSRTVVVYR